MEKLEQIKNTLEELQDSIIKYNNERSENPDRKMISCMSILFEGEPNMNDTVGIIGTGYTDFLIYALNAARNDLLTEGIVE